MLENSTEVCDSNLLEEQRKASLELSAPRLDGYEVLELIGEGTYGAVWKALEVDTNVVVAIKRFRQQPTEQTCAEVEHLARLNAARGIVALHKVHLQSEPYCYAMEYMSAGNLSESLLQSGPRGFQQAWCEFRQLIEALCYVHRDGIVHGDIKPDNILLDTTGSLRLCDFGQARLRGSHGRTLGTQFYMAPEQARLEGLPDPRWDVYSMGAILYELLTGKKPRFDEEVAKMLTAPTGSGSEARDRLEHYARHLERKPLGDAHRRVPGVDSPVAGMLEQCLSLDFERRPADANAVLQLIEQCERKRRSKPLLVFGGLAPAVLFLLLGVFFLVSGHWMLGWVGRAWKANALASNGAIAQSIASSMSELFNNRMNTVRRAARKNELRTLLDKKDKDGLADELARLYDSSEAEVCRWAVNDAEGWQLANYGRHHELEPDEIDCEVRLDDTTIDKNFSWRGWFNRQEDRSKHTDVVDLESVEEFSKRPALDVFVAPPFWREGENGFAVMCISCTIARSNEDRPNGVLLGVLPYNKMVSWISSFAQSQQSDMRSVIVVNEMKQVIYSPQLVQLAEQCREWQDQKPPEKTQGNPPVFTVEKVQAAHFDAALPNETKPKEYNYSSDGRSYLAASATAVLENGQKFVVLVQQDVEVAMNTINTLRNLVYGLGLILLAIGVMFLASNAYALYWFLRHQRGSAAYA